LSGASEKIWDWTKVNCEWNGTPAHNSVILARDQSAVKCLDYSYLQPNPKRYRDPSLRAYRHCEVPFFAALRSG
jgi:hypothetical protein